MAHYEIRVVRRNAGPVILLTEHVSDFAAVRSARNLTRPGDGLEVWNDDGCIYSSPPSEITASANPG